jgi:hypothetical protein
MGGGYPAPGMGGYAPPGPGYGPAPGAAGGLGTRVVFGGDGGTLFGAFLLYGVAPWIAVGTVAGILFWIGSLIDPVAGIALAAPVYLIGLTTAPILFMNKFFEFYYEALKLDGQPCQYTGTFGSLFKLWFINSLLIGLTLGIYTPWAIVKLKHFLCENVRVAGQPGRLSFHGDGGTLLGTYILGAILTECTLGIYGPWFANDVFAFMWDNTKLDGRQYQFKKDPGGFFGTYLLAIILTMCTLGIYYPWGICNILKWEAERVT